MPTECGSPGHSEACLENLPIREYTLTCMLPRLGDSLEISLDSNSFSFGTYLVDVKLWVVGQLTWGGSRLIFYINIPGVA